MRKHSSGTVQDHSQSHVGLLNVKFDKQDTLSKCIILIILYVFGSVSFPYRLPEDFSQIGSREDLTGSIDQVRALSRYTVSLSHVVRRSYPHRLKFE